MNDTKIIEDIKADNKKLTRENAELKKRIFTYLKEFATLRNKPVYRPVL